MLCPLTDVDLKLNHFVNVTCSFNIRGEYFKARYFFYHNFEPTYLINGSTNSTGIRSNRMINCLLYIKAAAPQRQFLENVCSEDDWRSRLFGTFVVNFLPAYLS